MEGILIKLINLNDRCYEVTVVTSTDSTMLFDVEVSVLHLKRCANWKPWQLIRTKIGYVWRRERLIP